MASANPNEAHRLIVVTGAGRSGTTALWYALAAHPDVAAPAHVQNIVFDLLTAAHVNRTAATRRVAMRLPDEAYGAVVRRTIFDLVFPAPVALPDGGALLVFSNLCPATAAYLLELHRGARIVCLVRDGVEVVRSRRAHEHFRPEGFDRHCLAWANAAAVAAWGESEERCVVVRHDRLRREPEAAAGEALRFCGLAASDAVAAHLRGRVYHPTPSADAGWERWSEEERRRFETICGEGMERLGYATPWRRAAVGSTRVAERRS